MKHWLGLWLIAVAILHTLLAFVFSGRSLQRMAELGIWNSVARDPQLATPSWFILFGALLLVCGVTLSALERAAQGAVPRAVGWGLVALATLGVVLMPVSGFWLAYPPAVAILRRIRR
jgi:hypothetical protein